MPRLSAHRGTWKMAVLFVEEKRIRLEMDRLEQVEKRLYDYSRRLAELGRQMEEIAWPEDGNGNVYSMEGVREDLKRLKERLEEKTLGLCRMIAALEQALERYRRCEERICEHYESGKISGGRVSIGSNEIRIRSRILEEADILLY